MNLTDLETFLLVADLGTMKAAAQKLGVPTSTVSRRVARLEDDLNTTLLRRSHRSFTLTNDGHHLFLRCNPLLVELNDAITSLQDQHKQPQGPLHITAPQDLASTTFIAESFASFLQTWPNITLHLDLTNRHVALAEEGFDVAIRAHGQQLHSVSNLMTKRLGLSPLHFFASPTYLQNAPPISHPDDLQNHTTHTHTIASSPLTLQHPSHPPHTVTLSPSTYINDFNTLLTMTLAHAGVCAFPLFLAGPYERSKQLQRVLPDWSTPGSTISLLWPKSRHMAPRIRAFIDFMTLRFATNPDFKNTL